VPQPMARKTTAPSPGRASQERNAGGGAGGSPAKMPPGRAWIWFAVALLLNFVLARYLVPGAEAPLLLPYTVFKEQVSNGNVAAIFSRGETLTGRLKAPLTYPPAGEQGAVLVVASADDTDHRNVAAQAMLDHGAVAHRQAFIAEVQQAQGIVAMNVHACVVDHQIRLVQRQEIAERIVDSLQVVRVAEAWRESDVPVAAGLAGREILLAMQRHRDRIRNLLENPRGAVALVDVAIEDQHAPDSAAFQQRQRDDGEVVEDAEAGRMIVMGMVRAAGQVAGQAVPKREVGRQQRAADRPHGALRKFRAPRQTQAAQLFTAHVACAVALDIAAIMSQREDLGRTQLRANQSLVSRQAAGDKVVAQQAKLFHGETVARRQRQHELIRVKDLHEADCAGLPRLPFLGGLS